MWIKVDCKNNLGLIFEHDGIIVDIDGTLNPEHVMVIHEPVGKRVIVQITLSQFMKMTRTGISHPYPPPPSHSVPRHTRARASAHIQQPSTALPHTPFRERDFTAFIKPGGFLGRSQTKT